MVHDVVLVHLVLLCHLISIRIDRCVWHGCRLHCCKTRVLDSCVTDVAVLNTAVTTVTGAVEVIMLVIRQLAGQHK